MRFAKFSRDLTKAAHFADKRSRIGLRPNGSMRFELEGIDKKVLREAVLERDEYTCVDADKGACYGPLELSHEPPMSESGGSDTMDGTKMRCRFHHRVLDGHGAPLHFSAAEDLLLQIPTQEGDETC